MNHKHYSNFIYYHNIKMSKLTINTIDYCVISSCYTSRLVELFGFTNVQIQNYDENCNRIMTMKHDKDSDEYKALQKILYSIPAHEDFEDNFIDNCVFIEDPLWGDGTYCNDLPYKVDNIKNILKKSNVSTDIGTICFKCNHISETFAIMQTLEKLRFCGCFCMSSITQYELVESDGIKILITYVDCESG